MPPWWPGEVKVFLGSPPGRRVSLPAAPEDTRAFHEALVGWFEAHQRELPWRVEAGEQEAYAVLVREVMLQQTRMETALPYLEAWLERWPTVEALAGASEDEVLDAWQGLGYYNRARWLANAARQVVDDHGGKIPRDPNELQALSGVGPYTAAAVASMAYGAPAPAVDGNVVRLVSRLQARRADAASEDAKARIRDELTPLLQQADDPGQTNEALMELGATVCTPRDPDCPGCPVASWCTAHRQGDPGGYPGEATRAKVHELDVVALWLERAGQVLVRRRPSDALLGGLWGLPMVELDGQEPSQVLEEELGLKVDVEPAPVGHVRHAFTHKRWTVAIHRAKGAGDAGEGASDEWAWVRLEDLEGLVSSTLDGKVWTKLCHSEA